MEEDTLTALAHLTPALSPLKGGEGDCVCILEAPHSPCRRLNGKKIHVCILEARNSLSPQRPQRGEGWGGKRALR